MSTGKKKSFKSKFISVAFVVLWMIFIFANSAVTGENSNKTSLYFTDRIIASIKKISPNLSNNVDKINFFVRKNGHGLEYLVLALLVANVFRCFSKKPKEVFITILFICLLYAVSDEFHQSFVPGRSSMVSDVLIDFGGSLIGTIIYYFGWAIRIK